MEMTSTTFFQDLWNASSSSLYTLGEAVGILLLSIILGKLFAKYIFKLVLNITHKTKTDLDQNLWVAFEKPLRMFIIITGAFIALRILPLYISSDYIVLKLYRSSIIAMISWGFFNLTGSSSLWLEQLSEKYKFDIDKILIPFFSKALRFVVIALSISIVAQEWNYNVTGFIAGLGLGGLAFALAAKDAISNIFGGVVIITEKPFSLGDWIETPTVEGTVEGITFRSTKIRTFSHALVTVPNSTLANEAITNWSKMGKRRITFDIGVTYSSTRQQLQRCVDEIRSMLQQHPEIHKETIFVHFDKFNDSSLNIFLYFFTHTTSWGEWLKVREDCNFKIMEILEKQQVEFAFPSTSIYFENALERKNSVES